MPTGLREATGELDELFESAPAPWWPMAQRPGPRGAVAAAFTALDDGEYVVDAPQSAAVVVVDGDQLVHCFDDCGGSMQLRAGQRIVIGATHGGFPTVRLAVRRLNGARAIPSTGSMVHGGFDSGDVDSPAAAEWTFEPTASGADYIALRSDHTLLVEVFRDSIAPEQLLTRQSMSVGLVTFGVQQGARYIVRLRTGGFSRNARYTLQAAPLPPASDIVPDDNQPQPQPN